MCAASDDVDHRLEEFEDRIASLDARQQQLWGLVLAFLEDERKAAREQQGRLDRAIGGLGEPGK